MLVEGEEEGLRGWSEDEGLGEGCAWPGWSSKAEADMMQMQR